MDSLDMWKKQLYLYGIVSLALVLLSSFVSDFLTQYISVVGSWIITFITTFIIVTLVSIAVRKFMFQMGW